MPLPSLGAVYGTRPSSLVVGKVESGCPILVLHHVAPRMGGWMSLAIGYRYSYCPYVVSSGNPAALLT